MFSPKSQNISRRLFNFVSIVFALVALAGIFNPAHAADVKFTWTAPTTDVNGVALPTTGAGSLTSYQIEWGNCTTAAGVVPQVLGTVAGSQTVMAPATSAAGTGFTANTVYCFRMYALVGTLKSAPSAVVRYWVPAAAAAPNAPTGLTVISVGTAP